MEATSLSLAVVALREVLARRTGLAAARVPIGTPHQAQAQQREAPDETLLNLYVFDARMAGTPPDDAGRALMQLRCLVTPMSGRPGPDMPGTGEQDLRLLGAVAAALHLQPTIDVMAGDQRVARLQVVPIVLGSEELQALWSSQPEVPSRVSLVYELSLLPVPLQARPDARARVGEIDLRVQAGGAAAQTHAVSMRADDMAPPGGPGSGLTLSWLDESGVRCWALRAGADEQGPLVNLLADGPEDASIVLWWDVWNPGSEWRDKSVSMPWRAGGAARGVRAPIRGTGQLLLRAASTPDQAAGLRSNVLLLMVG